MSCPPSITPDFSCGDGGGGGGGVQTVSGGTNITITGTPTDPIINASAGLVPRPSATIFVSPSGNDTTADGSVSLPFLTIQAAINFRNTLSNTLNIEIYIYSGTYGGNLTINTSNTYFTGTSSPFNDKTVNLTGTINVDITNLNGQGTGEVAFSNIGWGSTNITTGSTVAQGLQVSFFNCNMTGWFLHNQSSATSYNVRYFNCIMFHNGSEALITSVGCFLQVFRCNLRHANNITNPIINIQNGGGGNAGNLSLQYTTIISSTASATAQPIIRFQNTASSTNNIFTYNSLTYLSSTVDTGTNKCCIQFNQTGTIFADLVAFNTFECDGAQYTGGQPYAIQKRGAGAVTFNVFGGNYGGQLAHKIDPAINRLSNMVIVA